MEPFEVVATILRSSMPISCANIASGDFTLSTSERTPSLYRESCATPSGWYPSDPSLWRGMQHGR